MVKQAKKKGGKAKKAAAKTKSRKTATTASKAKARKKTAKKAAKKAPARRGTTSAKKPRAGKKSAEVDTEATLSLDELEDIDGLVADPAPAAAPASSRKRGPVTPSVPRSVKPPPRDVELDMNDEVLAFIEAIDTYRQENSRPFPSWTEVFYILKQLGYAKS